MVDWIAPFDPHSEITSFIVVYQLWSTSLAIETPRPPVTLSNVNSTTYTINNLLQDSTYKVVVYATTVYGSSSPSEELIVATTATGMLTISNYYYLVTYS